MTLSTYLTFDGDCKEAFDFYKSVFGGDFMACQTFADGPPEMGASEDDKDRIMHVSLPIGDSVLMGSDTMPGYGDPLAKGNNFSISYAPSSKEDADEKFAALKVGGVEKMELQETFWGSYFGMCTDQFGVNWMLNYNLQK